MRSILKITAISFIMVLATLISTPVQADPPGMPGGHGSNGDTPPGGGAPIGGGVLILSSMALAYGLGKRKISYQIIDDKTMEIDK